MPSIEEILRYFVGSWRLMTGRRDGLRHLDLSADGFWNSFYAMLVALPVLLPGWVTYANRFAADPEFIGSRVALVLKMAIASGGTWLIPIALLAFVAPHVGIADRFVAYVVASNWGTALFSIIGLPQVLLEMFVPESRDVAVALLAILFVAGLVMSWFLTNSVLNRGPAMATAVFLAMTVGTILLQLALGGLFGIPTGQSG